MKLKLKWISHCKQRMLRPENKASDADEHSVNSLRNSLLASFLAQLHGPTTNGIYQSVVHMFVESKLW